MVVGGERAEEVSALSEPEVGREAVMEVATTDDEGHDRVRLVVYDADGDVVFQSAWFETAKYKVELEFEDDTMQG